MPKLAPVFYRCKLGVIYEIYTDFTLVQRNQIYQRYPFGYCVFLLTLYPPNPGKTNMVQLIRFHVCEKQVGEPYSLESSKTKFHVILDFL